MKSLSVLEFELGAWWLEISVPYWGAGVKPGTDDDDEGSSDESPLDLVRRSISCRSSNLFRDNASISMQVKQGKGELMIGKKRRENGVGSDDAP